MTSNVDANALGQSEKDFRNFHIPVLLDEVLSYLNPRPGEYYIDGTLGGGGHAEALLKKYPSVQILGIDRDPFVLEIARKRLAEYKPRVRIEQGKFSAIDSIAENAGFKKVSGILFDLGVSSFQLDDALRGFSFQTNGPLDMRMNPLESLSADRFLSTLTEKDLCRILRKYGEEPKAKKIAVAIVDELRTQGLKNTVQLADLIKKVTNFSKKGYSKSVARCFQAIRIAVNDELELLKAGLEKAIEILQPGGRFVVISFHSLEDRIVKEKFNLEALDCICPPDFPICCCNKKAKVKILTRKPIQAGPKEYEKNSRSHSAKLRAVEKI